MKCIFKVFFYGQKTHEAVELNPLPEVVPPHQLDDSAEDLT